MENTSFVDTLTAEKSTPLKNQIEITTKNVKEIILDFELENNILIRAINMYYRIYGDNIIELLQRLVSMYNITESSKILSYVLSICTESTIPLILRLETCKELCTMKPLDKCFESLDSLCHLAATSTSVTTTSRIDAICVLFRNETFRDSSVELFKNIIDDPKIECKYRYKCIFSLKINPELQKNFYIHFIQNKSNEVLYRILACQYLLSELKIQDCEMLYDTLLEIGSDDTQVYNTRADATDMLLKFGSGEVKEKATILIKNLGRVGAKHDLTMFENAQNAHVSSIEKSAVAILERLYEMNFKVLDFNVAVCNFIKRVPPERLTIIERVFSRIEMDTATYSKIFIKLSSVFSIIYSFIELKKADVLFDRLIVELVDCDGICSTGIFERIINSISGFEDFMLTISVEEQIESNLFGRLNSKISKLTSLPCLHNRYCDCFNKSCFVSKVKSDHKKYIKKLGCKTCAQCRKMSCIHECGGDICTWNSELQALVLEEMLIPTSRPAERTNFSKIYNLYISDIMEEMRREFLELLDADTFTIYFRRAMSKYESI